MSCSSRFWPAWSWIVLLLAAMGGPFCNSVVAQDPSAKIKVLIVDGQHNHDWQATSPVIAQFLTETGRFEVERATSPPRGENLSTFRPRFSSYNVVLLNYNGLVWSETTSNELVNFVNAGGGLVLFHAANNAFPKWPEYNAMIGLGGGGGRDQESGPYLRLRDGAWVRDDGPGPGGRELEPAPFVVETFNPEHPVMQGLPARWMHAADQLVYDLRGPAENVEVLAMASAPTESGAKQAAPMIFTVKFGKGRVFHTPMGHDVAAVTCLGFVTILRRGVEWAATGNVSLPAPENFPTVEESRFWKPQPKEPADPGS